MNSASTFGVIAILGFVACSSPPAHPGASTGGDGGETSSGGGTTSSGGGTTSSGAGATSRGGMGGGGASSVLEGGAGVQEPSGGQGGSGNAGEPNGGNAGQSSGDAGGNNDDGGNGGDATVPNPCQGVVCNDPPAATCKDASTRTTYAKAGTCLDGNCSFATKDVTCPFGCSAGACKADPCKAITCDANQTCGAVGVCAVCTADSSCGYDCTSCPQDTPKCLDLGSTSQCTKQCSTEKDCPWNLPTCDSKTKLCVTGWQWLSAHGSSAGDDSANGVAVTADGAAVVVAGQFFGTDGLEQGLTSAGGGDVFVAKYAPDSSVTWAVQGGGTADDVANGVALAADGSIYVTGAFKGTATFGTKQAKSAGLSDAFLAKYNAAGVAQWVVRAGGPEDDTARAVAVLDDGTAYIAGAFSGTATFDAAHSLVSAGRNDVFLAKYSAAGKLLWAIREGGVNDDTAFGLATLADGTTYIAGDFDSTSVFGSTNLTAHRGVDVFVARHTPAGVLDWAVSGGSGTFLDPYFTDHASAVAVAPDGSAWVTGMYSGDALWGGYQTSRMGAGDMFLVHYLANGGVAYANKFGTSQGYDLPRGITIAADGAVWVTGESTSWSIDDVDSFLVRFSAEGVYERDTEAGGPGDDRGAAVTAAPDGTLYQVGSFTAKTLFAPYTAASLGSSDAYIAKYQP